MRAVTHGLPLKVAPDLLGLGDTTVSRIGFASAVHDSSLMTADVVDEYLRPVTTFLERPAVAARG